MKTAVVLLISILTAACSEDPDLEKSKNGNSPISVKAKIESSSPSATDLLSQANFRIQNQQYGQALADMETATELVPDNPEYALLYCMLKERAGEPLPEARACYADVVERLSQDDGTACASNINCVVADLMAGGANAEQRKTYFLGLPASETESEMRHFLLDDFDRKQYLHTILP